MEKNTPRLKTIIQPFIMLTIFFWVIRIIFIYVYTERTFPCEWRVGNFAHDVLTNPLYNPLEFLAYTCVGVLDIWQLLEGVFLVPLFILFGHTLFSIKLLAAIFSYFHLLGWYLLISKVISKKIALIFSFLYVFSVPFYLEGTMILQGTEFQSNLLIPYALLILCAILNYETKYRNYLCFLLGILIGIGLYFNHIYYISFFCFSMLIFLRKPLFRKQAMLFMGTFLIFTLPFFIYGILKHEMPFSHPGKGVIFFSIYIPFVDQPGIFIERAKALFFRNLELFTYHSPKFLGVLLFGTFLSACLSAIVDKKRNKIAFAIFIIILALNLGRLFAKIRFGSPIDGSVIFSGRYFIFGFELTLIIIAYFLATLKKNKLGMVLFYFCLFCFAASALLFVFKNFNIFIFNRSFPSGYDYEDVGERSFYQNKKDYRRAFSLIVTKKNDRQDREKLIEGLTNNALISHFLEKSDFDLTIAKKMFPKELFLKYREVLDKSLLRALCFEYGNNPSALNRKIRELKLEGVKIEEPFSRIPIKKDLLGLIELTANSGRNLSNSTLELCAELYGANSGLLNGYNFTKNLDYMDKNLEMFPDDLKRSIAKGYFRGALNDFSQRNLFGSLYILKKGIKNKNFRYKNIFLEELQNLYGAIYGQHIE